jgi:hypothetical protein
MLEWKQGWDHDKSYAGEGFFCIEELQHIHTLKHYFSSSIERVLIKDGDEFREAR